MGPGGRPLSRFGQPRRGPDRPRHHGSTARYESGARAHRMAGSPCPAPPRPAGSPRARTRSQGRFDTPRRRAVSSLGRTRAVALSGARRVCVPLGVGASGSQGRMERITDSPDGQADISAQEATSRQGARVPRPDEDPGWSTGARRAPRQGPSQAHGLTTPVQGPRAWHGSTCCAPDPTSPPCRRVVGARVIGW